MSVPVHKDYQRAEMVQKAEQELQKMWFTPEESFSIMKALNQAMGAFLDTLPSTDLAQMSFDTWDDFLKVIFATIQHKQDEISQEEIPF